MKFRMLTAALVVMALVGYRSLQAEDKTPGADVKCPVSGKAVKADKTVDFGGGKVYFCCENCPKAFAKDTDKFKAKANHQLAQTGQLTQKACPVSGHDTKAGNEVTIDGVKVGMCCEKCKAKIEAMSADDQMKAVFNDVSKSYETAKK